MGDDAPVVTDPFDERVVELGRLVVFSKISYKLSSLHLTRDNGKTNLNTVLV